MVANEAHKFFPFSHIFASNVFTLFMTARLWLKLHAHIRVCVCVAFQIYCTREIFSVHLSSKTEKEVCLRRVGNSLKRNQNPNTDLCGQRQLFHFTIVWDILKSNNFFFSLLFVLKGERAMSPAQSEDSGLAADRGTTYASISLPRENAQAMGVVFLGKYLSFANEFPPNLSASK